MAHVIEVSNPFDPLKDTRRYIHPGAITIRAWLEETFPGFTEFSHPTICIVNGEPILRADWLTYRIKPNDIINFVRVPGDPYTLLYILYAVIVIAAVAIVLSMPKPKIPGELQGADPVYDIKGQRNQNRFGSPIEVPYGYCRLFPSYAARSYNSYEGNQAYQFSLYCLGQGSYLIDKIQYEDTAIADFQDVQYEIYGPGEPSDMFPDDVVTSSEVGGIELLGTNEPGYVIVGPFSANDAGTVASSLEVDVVFPAGLYHGNNDGSLGVAVINCKFEYREIDGSGMPVGSGDWLEFFTLSEGLATTTPQRFTLSVDVSPARYEVRGYRTNTKQTSTAYGNVARWDGLRAFLPSTVDYGNVTRIAVKARATNNLNDNSAQRFNVWATRKLRIWDSGTHTWSAETATRNPVWALCDSFQAPYGGQLDDQFLDLDGELSTLAATFETENRYFDFVFDQPSTAWETATTIARVARCTPIPNISQITLVRDTPKSLATAVFTPNNITKGSFSWEIKLANISDYDGVQIEYTDPNTFLAATVDCLIGDDEGLNLEQIKLPGCTNRDFAYREGMYIRSTRVLLRENISFTTELEGHIPAYGDLISVSHDLPKWGTSGQVVSISGSDVVLNEPVTFVGSCVIGFKKKDGSLSGPYACVAGSDGFHITLTESVTDEFFFDTIHELPFFQFGPVGSFSKLCVVTNLQPEGDNKVAVSAVAYNEDVFLHDSDTAPAPGAGSTPHTSTIPHLNCDHLVKVWEPLADAKIRLSWTGASNARGYRVETTNDGSNWTNQGETNLTYILVDGIPGQDFNFRVTPLGIGSIVGSTCTGVLTTGFRPNFSPPPPPGGQPTYSQYFSLETLFPALAAYTLTCKQQSGTASLAGFAELADTSTPPKKYLKISASGTVTDRNYVSSTGCTTTTGDFLTTTLSGHAEYDPVTLSYTDTTNQYTISATGVVYNGTPTFPTGSETSTCNYNIALTSTSYQSTPTSSCCPITGADVKADSSSGLNWTLSIEDTDDNALSRLKGNFVDWSTVSEVSFVDSSCNTVWGVRTSGFTYPYGEAKVHITASGYFGDWDYTLRFKIMQRTAGSSDPFTEAGHIDVLLPSETDGSIDQEFDVPVIQGFETYITDPVFQV